MTKSAQEAANLKEWPLSFVFVSACLSSALSFFLTRTGSKTPEVCIDSLDPVLNLRQRRYLRPYTFIIVFLKCYLGRKEI